MSLTASVRAEVSATTSGGSVLRIGGVQGESYEIYIMGN